MVYGSKIRVKVINALSGTANNFYVIPTLGDGPPAWASSTSYNPIEQPYAKGGLVAGYTVGSPGSVVNYKHYMTTKKMYDVKGELDFNDFGSVMTANPTRIWCWMLYTTLFAFNDGAIAPGNGTFLLDIKITYYCKFFQRVFLQES